jgi:tRNA/tmRNA/rRNA uracil-C5-methylase (TrmA/RlmC/RlmD family)
LGTGEGTQIAMQVICLMFLLSIHQIPHCLHQRGHLYKRHLAEHFCGMGANMTAVELGVYHGYTTSLLANMFKKVIAVDVNKGLIEIAAKTLGELEQENVEQIRQQRCKGGGH